MAVSLFSPASVRSVRKAEHQAALARLFTRIGEVSSLPTAALKIVNIAQDETAGINELLAVVEGDPALAVRVLRSVNSSLYSVRNRVSDLRTAISLLGVTQVRNLALTVQVARMFKTPGDYRGYSRQRLWTHQVAVAATARLVAEECGAASPDEAYLAGLLHDLGWVLLDQNLRRPFKQLLDRLEPTGPTLAAERELLTFDHGELGAFVMERWNLAGSVVAAAGYHHAPCDYEGPHASVVQIVAIANYLCSRQGVTSLGRNGVDAPEDVIYQHLGLVPERMAKVLERLEATLAFAATASAL